MLDNPFVQMLREWQSFYTLVGTASAGLIGLIFVAISLGADVTFADTVTTVHTWVTPIIIQFGSVLIIAVLITVPTLTSLSLSGFLALAGLAGLGYVLNVGVRLRRQLLPARELLTALTWYAALPAACYLLIVGTAAGLALSISQVLNGLALGVALLLVLGIRNTWELTLWLVQRRRG